MQKFQIQNMVSSGNTNIPPNAKYSINIGTYTDSRSNRITQYYKIHDYNEMVKYQRIFMFECFLYIAIDTYKLRTNRAFYNQYYRNRRIALATLADHNHHNLLQYRSTTPIQFIDDVVFIEVEPVSRSKKMMLEDMKETFVIGDPLKYMEMDVADVCKKLLQTFKLLCSKYGSVISKETFSSLVFNICPEFTEEFDELYETMISWDEDAFVGKCKALIKSDYYDDVMKQNNVKFINMNTIKYDKEFNNKWILPRAFNALNFYEALTHTTKNVYISPSKNNYDIVNIDDVDYRIIDKVVVYFDDYEDLVRFMNVYSSSGKMNETLFYAGYYRYPTETSKVTVKQFDVNDLKRISEKLGIITTNATISPRKTTYENGVYGYLHLPMIMMPLDDFRDDKEPFFKHADDYVQKLEKDLSKLEIYDATIHMGTFEGHVMFDKRIVLSDDDSVMKCHRRMKLFDNHYALKNLKKYHIDKYIERSTNYTAVKNFGSPYYAMSSYVVLQPIISIKLESNNDIDKYLKYINRSKLLGDGNICCMELAPYAGTNDEISKSIVDAIMKL